MLNAAIMKIVINYNNVERHSLTLEGNQIIRNIFPKAGGLATEKQSVDEFLADLRKELESSMVATAK